MVTGIHHIALKCNHQAEFNNTVHFYRDILGLKIVRQWNGGIMLDTGNGIIEIFSNGVDRLGQGTIRHFALGVDEVDQLLRSIREAGYRVTMEPTDITLVDMDARIAFVEGPVGEEIELFCVKGYHN